MEYRKDTAVEYLVKQEGAGDNYECADSASATTWTDRPTAKNELRFEPKCKSNKRTIQRAIEHLTGGQVSALR